MAISYPEEKELRKAWLKRRFLSFDYHEELLRLHEQWREVLRRALVRASQDQRPNQANPHYATIAEEAENFKKTYMPIIESKPKPGDYKRENWWRDYATGLFRSIPDYGRYLVSEADALTWMTEEEDRDIGRYWGPMAKMATNIRQTVDELWGDSADDTILVERYTGPITWPPTWRNDVADLAGPLPPLPGVPANHPCPRDGYWHTPAWPGSRRYFVRGQPMPDGQGDYGLVIWQWDERQ